MKKLLILPLTLLLVCYSSLALSQNYYSPINIVTDIIKKGKAVKFQYQPAPILLTKHLNSYTLSYDKKPKQTIKFDNTRYRLVKIDLFHPSQHQILYKSFPMEAQLVHEDKKGNRLIVAVFIEQGNENLFLKTLLLNAPSGQEQVKQITAMQLNPARLIPEQQNFYSFIGSTTTLPYTEGVHWVVMESPITATQEEIQFFKKDVAANDQRIMQPLAGRKIIKFYT